MSSNVMNQAPSPEGEAMAVFARVVWSAHILKYWTLLRGVKSHKPFEKELVDDLDLVEQLDHFNLAEADVEAFDEEDEDDDVYNDVASDANAPLVADSESIHRKFLDHLAQTFPSAKGGPFVIVTALRSLRIGSRSMSSEMMALMMMLNDRMQPIFGVSSNTWTLLVPFPKVVTILHCGQVTE